MRPARRRRRTKHKKRGVKAISVKKIIGPLAVYAAACVGYGRCTGDVLGYGLAWNMALALLPPEIEVGSKIKCEYFQYEIIG